MLDQVNDVFGIKPEFDLDIHRPGQTLTDITTRVLRGVQAVLHDEQPDAVVVQGDTTTVFAAALAAFYEQIPVVHLEAGLRTGDPYSPYPEEINRRLATRLAALHLAPTAHQQGQPPRRERDPASVVVTGNTVIDALLWAVGRQPTTGTRPWPAWTTTTRPCCWSPRTGASHGGPRCAPWAGRWPGSRASIRDLRIVFPVHRNPLVRDAILPAIRDLPNMTVTEPLPYGGFARLMKGPPSS